LDSLAFYQNPLPYALFAAENEAHQGKAEKSDFLMKTN
jgi:hypothetical protein